MSRSRPAYSASGTLVPSARVAVKSWVVVVIVLRSGVVLRPTVRRSGRSAAPEDGYEEVGGFLQRSQVPRGEQEGGDQAALPGVGEEVVEGVAPPGPEPDRGTPVGPQVARHAPQHLDPGALGEEGHDVAGAQDGVERLGDAAGGQVELGEGAELDPPARGITEPCDASG